ncbi:MAG: ankyrin repeat domain-containing protein, partial [Granulosicoccus sp.]|nr:ankyrin repeat domain-containing protein [Granulosicoccus sp.]
MKLIVLIIVLLLSTTACSRNTPLVKAVLDNDYEKFEKLLAKGEDPNSLESTDSANWLMCAVARNPDRRFLDLAVQYGGDVNIRNTRVSMGHSLPVSCAIAKGNMIGVEALLDYSVDTEVLVCSDCGDGLRKAYIPEYAFYADQIDIALKLYREVDLSEQAIAAMIRALEANNYGKEEMQQYH